MRFSVNDDGLRDLDRRIARAGRAFTPQLVGQTIARSAKRLVLPVLRNNTPIGTYKRTGKGRARRDGAGDGTYDRGGATRRDERVKVVGGVGDEISRILIGVSKRRGKVGWRTHFITKGTRHSRANDFIGRTESQTVGLVESDFTKEATRTVDRILSRA